MSGLLRYVWSKEGRESRAVLLIALVRAGATKAAVATMAHLDCRRALHCCLLGLLRLVGPGRRKLDSWSSLQTSVMHGHKRV